VSDVAKRKQALHNGMLSNFLSTKDFGMLDYYLLFPPSRYLSVSYSLQCFTSTQFPSQYVTYHLVVLQQSFMHLEDSPIIHTTLPCLIDSRVIIHYYKKAGDRGLSK